MLTQLIIWLNALANWLARLVFSPIAWFPGWFSATLIAVMTGFVMLIVFKYTSNQPAIGRTRSRIKAHLLSLSLFNENLCVLFRAQFRICYEAVRLMTLSLVPMIIMLLPMCLLLGQLSLWYQARPLLVGEPAIVTVQLTEDDISAVRHVRLIPSLAAKKVSGPVRVPPKTLVCWKIQAEQPGQHELQFEIDGQTFEKELAVGDSIMPVSLNRPAWNWTEALLHPRERPFAVDSPVQSIDVAYPERVSWTSGSKSWLIFWFLVSLLSALAARPLLNVNL